MTILTRHFRSGLILGLLGCSLAIPSAFCADDSKAIKCEEKAQLQKAAPEASETDKDLKARLKLEPDNALLHFNLANSLMTKGIRVIEAKRHFVKAATLEPSNLKFRAAAMKAFSDSKDYGGLYKFLDEQGLIKEPPLIGDFSPRMNYHSHSDDSDVAAPEQ